MPERSSDGAVPADEDAQEPAPGAGAAAGPAGAGRDQRDAGAAGAEAKEAEGAASGAAAAGAEAKEAEGAASGAAAAGAEAKEAEGAASGAAAAGASAPERDEHVMKRIRLEKIVLNMGVGQSGPAIEAAKKALAQISGCKPCPRSARDTQRDFGVRKGEPIGVAVTVRGGQAVALAARLFEAKGNSIAGRSFDDFGNFSFGIREHIDIPGVKYDPSIGIIGLDVCVSLSRPGYGIRKRSKHKASVGRSHRITAGEARRFVAGRFGIEVAA